MNDTLRHYEPSGRLRLTLLPRLLGAMGAAVLLAFGYEFLCFAVESIYVIAVLVFMFGALLGLLALWTNTSAKSRNRAVSMGVAGVVGVTGLLASYGWNYRRFVLALAEVNPGWSVLALARQAPQAWLTGRLEAGWMIGTVLRTGPFVVAMWALEAGIVLAICALIVRNESQEPFCEACDEWTKPRGLGLPGVARSEVEGLLQRGDLAALIALEPQLAVEAAQSQIVLTRHACPQCAETAFLSVAELTYSRGNDGALAETRTSLARYAVLPRELSQRLLGRIEKRDAS